MTEIKLSEEQEDLARTKAIERQSQSEARRNANRHGASANRTPEEDLKLHLSGCRGELAAAVAYGVDAPLHVNVYHSVADIGLAGEVRTRSRSDYDLLIRDDDAEDRYYILVIGTSVWGNPLTVVGGIWGKEAKNHPEWRKNWGGHGEAWFVPQEFLSVPEATPKGFV
jgi:hypothetical protein